MPVNVLINSTLSITAFQEVYPNRIPEDVFDSLEEDPDFVYVRYGPSLNNG